jgi:hypothetical protein
MVLSDKTAFTTVHTRWSLTYSRSIRWFTNAWPVDLPVI